MADISLFELTKRFDDVTALDHVSFDIPDHSFVILLGPTGAGKTTTLRCVAGLEKLDGGEVFINSVSVNHFSPSVRDVAFVSQHYALYPHYTVKENLLFPLRPRNLSKDFMEDRVRQIAGILRIEHLLERKPDKLSGGEMQRVAIGRAMVREPQLFLLDEPLSNLDAKLREELRYEMKRMQRETGATMLFVTHDQIEAMSMADRIVVLYQGKVQQIGAPKEIYSKPANTFVARFVGSPGMNLLESVKTGNVLKLADGMSYILPVQTAASLPDGPLTLGVRPEDVIVGTDADQPLTAEIYVIESLGSEKILDLKLGAQTLKARSSPRSQAVVGQQVTLKFKDEKVRFFDPQSGLAIL